MSLIISVNPLLPPLTTYQTHKKVAQNKNHVTFLSGALMFYICVVPLNTTDKDCHIFSYLFHTKKNISLLFY